MHVGITGHQNLGQRCAELVRVEIERRLDAIDHPFVGLTSLAAGADQIFAAAVLQAGGQLSVILPSDQIELSFQDPADAARFHDLVARAKEIVRMPFSEPCEDAYWAAGKAIAERSDLVLAVWDGRPAGGLGGTADVVKYARERGTTVAVIWPDGCARSG